MDDNQTKMLIERAILGDTEAFGKLYSNCKGNAYRVAYRMTLNHEDAEDVLSQAVEYGLKNIAKLNSSQSFDAWFIRIIKIQARQLCKIKIKDEKIKREIYLIKETEDSCHNSKEAIDTLVAKEQNHMLSEISKLLPKRARMILTDACIEGMSYEAMAEKDNCSLRNVHYRIKSAKQKARKIARKLNYIPFL